MVKKLSHNSHNVYIVPLSKSNHAIYICDIPILSAKLYAGLEYHKGCNSKQQNNQGLTLVMDRNRNMRDVALLPGDMSKYLVEDIYNQHTNNECKTKVSMVTPHHGGDIDSQHNSSRFVFEGKKTIMSFQSLNNYKHPSHETIGILLNSGFMIDFTGNIPVGHYKTL